MTRSVSTPSVRPPLRLGLGLALATCIGLTSACDAPSSELDDDLAAIEEGLEDELPVRILARVEFDDGATLEFADLGDGMRVVSELAPLDSPSRLDYLLGTYTTATPLEIYLSVEPNLPPPAELVEDHEEHAAELGLEDTPRELSLPLQGARMVGGSVQYPANCTYSSDHAWFKSVWQSAGWNWRWYYSGSATGQKTTPSRNTSSFYSHLCNRSVTNSPAGTGRLYHSPNVNGSGLSGWAVPVGYRNVFWAGSHEQWAAHSYKWASAPGSYRLGVMAP